MKNNLSYEDLCFLTALLRKIDEEEAITLMCILEQLFRAKEVDSGK